MSDPLVSVRGLRKEFDVRTASGLRRVVAVDDVDFEIARGETFGLVGESGSGKSTIARILLKVEKPSGGELIVDGRNIFKQSRNEEKQYRGLVQAVLQDPYGALSPRMKAADIIGEPLRARGATRQELAAAMPRLLELVGLRPELANRYPHEFSGGQRQRIAIARALSVDPKLLVLDEPVSALDVSVRAQVLLLLRDMRRRLGLTCLFIGHDLAIVRFISDKVGVIYFGRMVESGAADEVLRRPLHPYTRRLVAVSSLDRPFGELRLTGEIPNPLDPPKGCYFRSRCPNATDICAVDTPRLQALDGGRKVACHHVKAILDC